MKKAKTKTTLELNGKRYDATNGQVITDRPPKSYKVQQLAEAGQLFKVPAKPVSRANIARGATTAHKLHQKTERSQTLMRRTVKRPVLKKAEKPEKQPAKPLVYHYVHADHARMLRASHAHKSPQISKFGTIGQVVKKFTPIVVVEPPKDSIPGGQSANITTVSHTSSFEAIFHNAKSQSKTKPKNRLTGRLRLKPKS